MFGRKIGYLQKVMALDRLAFFVLIQYRSVTDGRTDGHSSSVYTSACIACYANALVKKLVTRAAVDQIESEARAVAGRAEVVMKYVAGG